MTAEDLTIVEQAGRRCSACNSGRHWRQLEVLRLEGRSPLVACPGCRPRLIATASEQPAQPKGAPQPNAAAQSNAAAEPNAATQPKAPSASARPRRQRRSSSREHEDRLRRTLRDLPAGTYSTERIAKAAGLNEAKVFPRLRALEAAGEVQRHGKRWSTRRPELDLEAAFDRLQAGTTNLRIIRPQQQGS